MESEVVARLRRLALEQFVRSPAELSRYARARDIKHTQKDAKEALKTNVASQVLAPKARFAGASAAERPGSRIQADLAEFPVTKKDPASTPYALVATDVFTRQTYAEPMADKTAATTNAAMQKVLSKMPEEARNAALTTDGGREFGEVDKVLQGSAFHRLKHGLNDIAVVDRAMQTLKGKLATARATRGGSWDEHLAKVVDSYNNNPRAAVHGPPSGADDPDAQGFLVLQDNANRFRQNFNVARQRVQAIQEAGAVRAAISDGARAHKPRYGPVREVDHISPGALHVVDSTGAKVLLKTALPVPRGSEEPQATFGTKEVTRRPMGVRSLTRRKRPMSGPIPAAASRAFDAPVAEASSSSVPQAPVEAHLGPAVRPKESVHDRLVALRLLHGGQVTKPAEERAALAAERERARVAREEEAARKALEKADKKKAEDERKKRHQEMMRAENKASAARLREAMKK